MKKIVKTLAGLVGAFVVLAVGYTAWNIWWEGRQIRAFCEAVHPGDPAASLENLGASRGVPPRRLRGVFDKERGSWYLFVPVGATMGDCGCRITHDGKAVLTAAMSCR